MTFQDRAIAVAQETALLTIRVVVFFGVLLASRLLSVPVGVL